jgi:uncharacterized membrane protein YqiK
VQSNKGKADLAQAEQQASQIRTLASAEAEKTRILGDGEAHKIKALASAEAQRVEQVGLAQALATQKQVEAYGGPRFQLTQQVMERFAQAVENSGIEMVPRMVVIGGGDGKQDGMSGNLMQGLLAMMLSDRMGTDLSAPDVRLCEVRDPVPAHAATHAPTELAPTNA